MKDIITIVISSMMFAYLLSLIDFSFLKKEKKINCEKDMKRYRKFFNYKK